MIGVIQQTHVAMILSSRRTTATSSTTRGISAKAMAKMVTLKFMSNVMDVIVLN